MRRKDEKSNNCISMCLIIFNTPEIVFAVDKGVDVSADIESTNIIVTIPTALPLVVTSKGETVVSNAVSITNNSIADVKVSNLKFITYDDWYLSPHTMYMDNASTNDKCIAMTINDNIILDSLNGTLVRNMNIKSNESLPINYSFTIPFFDYALEEDVGRIIFTIEWETKDSEGTLDIPKFQSELKDKSRVVFTTDEIVSGSTLITDLSIKQDGSILLYKTGSNYEIHSDTSIQLPRDVTGMCQGFQMTMFFANELLSDNSYNMTDMFKDCPNLEEVYIKRFTFDSESVVSGMFENTPSLICVVVGSFYTENLLRSMDTNILDTEFIMTWTE